MPREDGRSCSVGVRSLAIVGSQRSVTRAGSRWDRPIVVGADPIAVPSTATSAMRRGASVRCASASLRRPRRPRPRGVLGRRTTDVDAAASSAGCRGSIEAGPACRQLGERLLVEDLEHRVADVDHHVAQRAGRLVRTRAAAVVAQRDAGERRERPVKQPDDPPDRDGGGSAAIAYPPCAPSVVRTTPPCLSVAMICSRNLVGRLLRLASAASAIGPEPSWRTRSTSARRPYSERRDRRMRRMVAPKA